MIGTIYKISSDKYPNINYIGYTLANINDVYTNYITRYINYLMNISNNVLNNKNKQYYSIIIYKYFDIYGINNFKLEKIKDYYIVDLAHIKAYKQLYINKYKAINKTTLFNLDKLNNKRKFNTVYYFF